MGAASCSHEAPERPRESCCEAYLQDLGLGLGSEGSTGDSTGSRPAASPRASRPSRPSREPHGSEMGTLHVDGVGRASRRTTVMGGRSLHQQTGFFVYEGKLKEAEWLTVAVEKMWKYIERAIEKLLKEDITALIKDEVPMMNSFQFSKCNFGNQSPNFGPMKVRAKDNCVELQIDMHWTASGSEIEVTVGKMKLGMKDIKLNGPILLVFCPLMGELPITGGMSITFPDPPELTWNWTGLGKALAVDVIRKGIVHAIFQTLVVPSRVYVDIAGLASNRHEEMRVETFRSPAPIGALHFAVLEARNLPAADFGFTGKGSSDPYVIVKIGNCSFQTKCQAKTLDPVWGPAHSCDLLVYHMEQHIFVEVWDSDMVTSDDLLGHVEKKGKRPTVADFVEKSEKETWWTLKTESGSEENPPQIKLRCFFREVPEVDRIEAIPVNCNKRCGLVEVAGHSKLRPKTCSLCGSSFAKTWDQLCCGGTPVAQGQECRKCNFRCCATCLSNRRPAAGILRICLREGLVPPGDAADGVILGVKFENEMLWSKSSYKPHYVDESGRSEAQKWIRNLCARFDKASISKCLGMKPDKIQEVLDMSIPEVKQGESDLLQQEPVIWDHALHFLVRNPHSEISATVIYKGKSAKVERNVAILSGKKLATAKKAALRLVGNGKTKMQPQAFSDSGTLACDSNLMEATWTLDLDSKHTADVFVEVSLTPLESFY
ncbi:Extended synaptotagmin-2-B [Symbiodinium microadriaticum]|uniref:Extended synaptotagmin-2-B n=1 Tax=Symbiodinium microadriaticum TaxID=2951 RepID=A0A1Q9CRW9_SYMMI|nr:Extended synaptotagmin-2-B [Symbiodinium microadriaticum]